ncbi:related to diaminopropionate ammonia-lyase [Rhynchosporium secalis]|uniref:Related to diaminopropionate ammonia-lyase n=1 Tax=Rhynchosporium secalis TaxID=38038 RepID=A0A1E1LXF1_RHYSE|nr:related to diaminopropionate ammonia-lyase [Rhynchosporium secalis]
MSSRIFINTNRKTLESLPSRNPEVRIFHQSLPQYNTTPLVPLPGIAKELGIAQLFVKDESSRFGLSAFKILGASWATKRSLEKRLGLDSSQSPMSLQQLASVVQAADFTLYAATDGNQGRAVARMAKYLGIKARIFVPSMLDFEAKEKITNEGAILEIFDGSYDQKVVKTKSLAESHPDGKGVLISDTALTVEDETAAWIVEGYQTMFDEIEEQRREKANKPLIVTVEPETAACLKTSLEAGEPKSVDAEYTICTGMCCGTISLIGWPILRTGVSAAVTTTDVEVHKAVRELEEYGAIAGPCGAATLAGLRFLAGSGEMSLSPDSFVVILCTEGKRGYLIPG